MHESATARRLPIVVRDDHECGAVPVVEDSEQPEHLMRDSLCRLLVSALQRAGVSRGDLAVLPNASALERLDRARHVFMEYRVTEVSTM